MNTDYRTSMSSPLAGLYLDNDSRLLATGPEASDLSIEELELGSCWHLCLSVKAMRQTVEQLWNIQLPLTCQNRRIRIAKGELLNSGAQDWLLLRLTESRRELIKALNKQHYALNDMSQALVCLRLNGTQVWRCLQQQLTADIDPSNLAVNQLVRSQLAAAEVILLRAADNSYHLFVAQGLAVYVLECLQASLLDSS